MWSNKFYFSVSIKFSLVLKKDYEFFYVFKIVNKKALPKEVFLDLQMNDPQTEKK